MLIHASICRWAIRLDDESVEHLFGDVSGQVECCKHITFSLISSCCCPLQHSAIPHQADFVGSCCQQWAVRLSHSWYQHVRWWVMHSRSRRNLKMQLRWALVSIWRGILDDMQLHLFPVACHMQRDVIFWRRTTVWTPWWSQQAAGPAAPNWINVQKRNWHSLLMRTLEPCLSVAKQTVCYQAGGPLGLTAFLANQVLWKYSVRQ